MSTDLATRPTNDKAPKLRGIEKAAILLVAIGEERAGEIFRYLGETEVEALSLEIAKSRKVPNDICRDIISEAVETVLAEDYIAEGGVDYARNILERSLGANRAEEVASLRRTGTAMLDLGGGVRAIAERGLLRAERG